MFRRFQGLVLMIGSGVAIYLVATHGDEIRFRAGPIVGYVFAGAALLYGLMMLVTGEDE